MKRNGLLYLFVVTFVVGNLALVGAVQAGNEKPESKKREIYQNDSTESMRDVYVRRNVESKEYREKILSNSEESVKLLKDIKDLLKQLNEKE